MSSAGPARCRADEVVVAIAAASVNPLAVKLRERAFKLVLPYPMPLDFGHDLTGTLFAVGPGARRFTAGDEVFGRAGTKRSASEASPSASR